MIIVIIINNNLGDLHALINVGFLEKISIKHLLISFLYIKVVM